MMETELTGKQQEIEELSRELEELRATYGTEGLQQVWLPSVPFDLLLLGTETWKFGSRCLFFIDEVFHWSLKVMSSFLSLVKA